MNSILALGTCGLCVLAAGAVGACGGTHIAGFTNDPQSDDGGGGPDEATAASDGAAPSSGQLFTGSDAATPAFDCTPGTYSGPFTTHVVVGDAGPSPFSLVWMGTLTVTLVGKTVMTSAGELPTTTLTIAPGGRMEGTDMFHGSFGADVTGQLDCLSKTLQATISNGVYELLNDGGTLPFTGTVDGAYQAAMPPALNASIDVVTSPGALGALGATGTVTASLQ
jgi:hypothetical protein